LDGKRPDLTKLDTILGKIATESSFFPNLIYGKEKLLKVKGIKGLIADLEEKKKNANIKRITTASSTSQSDTSSSRPMIPLESSTDNHFIVSSNSVIEPN